MLHTAITQLVRAPRSSSLRLMVLLPADPSVALHIPNEGSSGSGNMPDDDIFDGPGAGVDIPAFTEVDQIEPDFVFNVTAAVYYAHLDPLCAEYVLDTRQAGSATACPAIVAPCPTGTESGLVGDDHALVLQGSGDGMIEVSALQVTTTAAPSTARRDRSMMRTQSQNRALLAAVEAQIAADKARLSNDAKSANARTKSAKATFRQMIPADKARLKARLNLGHVAPVTA